MTGNDGSRKESTASHSAKSFLSLLQSLSPRYHDILHDMEESEEFLVDGESLFLEALVDQRQPLANSGSPLQLIYWVESLLAKLHKRGGRFRIVFFASYEEVWDGFPEAAALRAVLFCHLQRALPQGVVNTFPSWWPRPRPKNATVASGHSDLLPGAEEPRISSARSVHATDDGYDNTARRTQQLLQQPQRTEGQCSSRSKFFTHFLISLNPTFVAVSDILTAIALQPAADSPPAPLSPPPQEQQPSPLQERLLASPQLHLAARLSTAFSLHCLRFYPCVFLSSLDFDAVTAYGFQASREGASRLLHTCWHFIACATRHMAGHLDYAAHRRRSTAEQHGDGSASRKAAVATAAPADMTSNACATAWVAVYDDAGAAGVVSMGAASVAVSPESAAPPQARGGGPLTPRAAVAAAVCADALQDYRRSQRGPAQQQSADPKAGRAYCSTTTSAAIPGSPHDGDGVHMPILLAQSCAWHSPDAVVWFCELYLLHAVLLDHLPLEHRALVSPLGELSHLYEGAAITARQLPQAATALATRLEQFMAGCVLPRLTKGMLAGDWDALGAKATATESTAGHAANADGVPAGAQAADAGEAGIGGIRAEEQVGQRGAVAAALADPYHGGLLYALAAALLLLRGCGSRCDHARLHVGGTPILPVGASEEWQTARASAGLPSVCLGRLGTVASHLPGEPDVIGWQLLDHLLTTMPWDAESDVQAADWLTAVLKVPTQGQVDSAADAGATDGPICRLDRAAQTVLVSAVELPQAIQRHPLVSAVSTAWRQLQATERGCSTVPSQQQAHATSQAGVDVAAGWEDRDIGGASCGVRAWGPWAHLMEPLLRVREEAVSGFGAAEVDERFHWHTRQLLQPAYLMQADHRESKLRYFLHEVYMTPADQLIRRFRRFLRPHLRVKLAKELKEGSVGMSRSVIQEAVEAWFNKQKNKEEAAAKRLIDSLQGGVTFFRPGGSGGPMGARGAASIQAPETDCELPLVVCALGEVRDVAHLEAIRSDKEGRSGLDTLLKAERMSAADFKRQLAKLKADQTAVLNRTAAKKAEALQGEIQRWKAAVGDHLSKLSGAKALSPEELTSLVEALQRFSTAPACPPELKVLASALILQAHHAALSYLQNRVMKKAGQAGSDMAPAAGSGAEGNDSLGGPPHAVDSGREPHGQVDGEAEVVGCQLGFLRGPEPNREAGSGSHVWAQELLHAGPAREALRGLLKELGKMKATCRTQKGLWAQPAPLLCDPRIGVPALTVACDLLQSLGFAGAAQKLRLEANWPEPQQLLEAAKSMDRRRKALSKRPGKGQATKGRQSGMEGAQCKSKKGGEASTSCKAGGGGNVGEEGYPCEVEDAVVMMYDKITSSPGFKAVDMGISLVRFQLRCMGDLLERPAGGRPDPRVAFIPDDWQRRLLDVVDSGASAVVSAPTSSGKTFISSYVVRRVLQQHGGQGRVVMVVPTKALVTQVRAQMAKDFHDVRSLPPGMVVEGAFTRDFRSNTFNCVVLVTVPQCLEILLLSSAHRTWVASIKHVIYDEVHCINGHDGMGNVWERMLLATRCPLLGLSATIGNPETFTDWLRRVKQVQRVQDEARRELSPCPAAYDVHLILHKERYNDLACSLYLPSLKQLQTEAPEVEAEDVADLPKQLKKGDTIGRSKSRKKGGGAQQPSSFSDSDGNDSVGAKRAAAAGLNKGASWKPHRMPVPRTVPKLPPPLHRVTPPSRTGQVWQPAPGGGPSSLSFSTCAPSPSTCCSFGGEILSLHPLLSIDLDRAAATGSLRGELSMTPGEVLQLYDGMVWQAGATAATAKRLGEGALAAAAEAAEHRLSELDPELLFSHVERAEGGMPPDQTKNSLRARELTMKDVVDGGDYGDAASKPRGSLISRAETKDWEARIKEELLAWVCAAPAADSNPELGAKAEDVASSRTGSANPWFTGHQGLMRDAAVAGSNTGYVESRPGAQQLGAVPAGGSAVGGLGGCRGVVGPWREGVRTICKALGARVTRREAEVQRAWSGAREGESIYGPSFQHAHLVSLVLTLHEKDKLPGIVFNFSRRNIEKFSHLLVAHLEGCQERYRAHYRQQLAPHIAAYEAAVATGRAGDDEEGDRSRAAGAADDPALEDMPGGAAMCRTRLIDGLTFSLDPRRPDPSFSLVPFGHMDDSRLLDAIKELQKARTAGYS